MNIVSKQDYWTTILNDLSQFGQISTEDPKFNEIADYVWRVLQNTLILTEDEKQIKHWEEIVNVSGEGLTQFQRKVNLLFLLSEKSYIPMNLLRKALDRLLGEGKYDLIVDDENDKVYLGFANYSSKGKAEFLLSKTVPSYYESEIEADRLPSDYFAVEFLDTQTLKNGGGSINFGKQPDGWGIRFRLCCYDPLYSKGLGSVFASIGWHFYLPYYVQEGYALRWITKNSAEMGTYILSTPRIQAGKIFYSEANYKANKIARIYNNDTSLVLKTDLPQTEGYFAASDGGKYVLVVFGQTPFESPFYFYEGEITHGNEVVNKLVPCFNPFGHPGIYDVIKGTFYERISWVMGLSYEQSKRLGNFLPSLADSLTISLPYEAQLVQHIEDVDESLEMAKNKGWTVTVQYRDEWSDENIRDKYAKCVTREEVVAINEDFINDLTNEGEWIYPLTNLTDASALFRSSTNLKKIDMSFPSVINATNMFAASGIEELNITLPQATTVMQWINSCSIKSLSANLPMCKGGHSLCVGAKCEEVFLSIPNIEDLSYAFSFSKVKIINSDHASLSKLITCNSSISETNKLLEEWPWELPNLKNGKGFGGILLNKSSTLRILNSIPTWTDGASHLLTIGIHIDNQSDEEVLAAISNAEAKGWTMTVQWNGTPTTTTASTYGLRKPPIYAKLGETVDINGETKPFLDWGHYVTNAEENGYQEFSSIEEANEYFNIESETEQ